MPQLGEIRNKKRYTACAQCGKCRWVEYRNGQPRHTLCFSCGHKADHNGNWHGGKKRSRGYNLIRLGTDDFFYSMVDKDGYVREHRLIMAKYLDRCLQSWEVVHHKDGIKDNNLLSNLELATKGTHTSDHNKGYGDGYRRGYQNGRCTKIQDLMQEIKLLQGRMSELRKTTNKEVVYG